MLTDINWNNNVAKRISQASQPQELCACLRVPAVVRNCECSAPPHVFCAPSPLTGHLQSLLSAPVPVGLILSMVAKEALGKLQSLLD